MRHLLVYFVSRDAAWQKYRYDTMRRLAGTGEVQVRVMTGKTSATWACTDGSLRYIAFRSWFPRTSRLSFFPGAILEVIRRRPHVVLAVNNASHCTEYALYFLRRVLGIRFVWWTHGYDHIPRRGATLLEKVRRAVMLHALRGADCVITFSERGRQALVSAGIPAHHVVHAPNTLDTDALLALARQYPRTERGRWCEELNLDPRRRYVVFTGRLMPSKCVLQAAAVFKAITERTSDAGWIVVGDGPDREALERYVANERVEGVTFLGSVFDDVKLAKIFAISDVLLMPVNVGLGIVHAFSFGVPIVTSACDTHGPELQFLEHGANGYLVSGCDPIAEMADCSAALLTDRALQQRLSDGATRTAAGPASIGGMIAAMRAALLRDRGADCAVSH